MRPIVLFGLFLIACCVGCGGKGFNVGGKVMFADGTPLTRGQVTFMSGTFTSGGAIAADGTYSVNVRVPAGTYKVSVIASGDSQSDPTVDVADVKPAKPLVDPKFNNPETSELVCEVKGPTGFDIKVEPPK
jgi:hypothetical protein